MSSDVFLSCCCRLPGECKLNREIGKSVETREEVSLNVENDLQGQERDESRDLS